VVSRYGGSCLFELVAKAKAFRKIHLPTPYPLPSGRGEEKSYPQVIKQLSTYLICSVLIKKVLLSETRLGLSGRYEYKE
jgi:hypothetical protein